MKQITYISETPQDYPKELTAVKTFSELVSLVKSYLKIAPDAYEAVMAGDPGEWFTEFQRGLSIERRGKYAGDEWSEKYAMIFLPEIMLRVAVVASNYHVPFGLAFIRCVEEKVLVKKGKSYKWIEPEISGVSNA